MAFVVFSGLQCVQDLIVSPPHTTYVFSLNPDSAVVNVGDTVAPFTGTLTADGRAVGFTLGFTVIEQPRVAGVDSLGRLVVLDRGVARLRVRPLSVALPVDTIADTVTIWAVVPRVGLLAARTADTLVSLGDTFQIDASGLTRGGVPILNVPFRWRQQSGQAAVTLLDSTTGKVRAEANGEAEFLIATDTATARRVVRVVQRPTTLINTADTVRLRAMGQTRSLGATLRDARANAVTNLTAAWLSKNTGIATVSGGQISAVGEGTTYVIASYSGGGVSLADTTTVVVQQARLSLLSGNAQAGVVGAALAAPFVVQLVDGAGAAIRDSGVAVVFGVPSGGGHFGAATDTLRTADTVRTDLQGQARTTATLGKLVGANAFSASGPGLAGAALAFTATATPAPLKTFLADSGTGQSGTVGQPLGRAFVVVARDTFGNAVSGVPVRFVVRSGGGKLYGTLDSVDATTDAAGRMRAILTLGHAAGPNEVEVTAFVAGGPYQRFTATGTPGPAKRLAFTVQPGTIVAGGSFVPAVQVTVRDTFANRVTGATNSVTLSIAAGTGTAGAALGGTKTVAAVDAVASFGVVTVDKSGTGFRLVATADGLGPDTSAAFNASASSADHMVFLAPPRGARAGALVYPPVQVAVVDASGNALTSFTGDVTLSIGRVPATGSDRYFGTPTVSAVAGVATFSDFGIQTSAPGYKLRAATPGLVAILSDLFDVSGPPATLQMVSGNNQGGIVNAVLADSLVVRVLDAGNYPVPGDTVVFRVTFGDGRFAGADSVVALTGVGGRATAALRLGATTGSDTVVVRSRSLAGQAVVFAATAVEAGSRLEFVTQPDTIDLGSAFSPAVQVRVRDGFGHTVTGATAVITLAVATGTGRAGATLTGTTAVAAVSGVATFTGVGVSRSGTDFRILATATDITSATSAVFDVQQVPASLVKDWGDLQSSTVGFSLFDNFVTRVLDAAGDPIVGDTVIYKVTSGPGSFGGVDSAIAVTDALGRALAGLALGATPGTVTVSARSTHLSGQSVTFTASATALGRALEFVTQPTTIVAGATFSPPVQVRVFDPGTGTTDVTATTFIRVSGPGLVLAGALDRDGMSVVAAVNGVATFSDLGVAGYVGTGYRLQANARGLVSAAPSAPFDVTVGAPAKLAFNPVPATLAAGEAFGFEVHIVDAHGNDVRGTTNAVTLALIGGTPGAHLRGDCCVKSAFDGIAFSSVNIDSAGVGYTLSATAAGLTGAVTSPFDVVPAPAVRLAFQVQPGTGAAGAALSPAVVVLARDSLGNTVTSSSAAVTLALGANPGGGVLSGTTSVAATGGVATFANLRLRKAATGYTLVASAPGLLGATSGTFAVDPAPASRLVFAVQPSNRLPAEAITPAVQVAVQDSVGNVVTGSAAAVTISITPSTGTAGASLAGTVSVGAVSGVAVFGDLSIATYGGGYTLTAMSSGLASAASNPFDILSATSNRLVVTATPTSANAGAPFAVSVEIRNAAGVKVATATDAVTLSLTGGTGTAGAHLRGTLAVAASAGVAVFQGVSIDSAGAGYTLTASASGLFSGTSPVLAIQPAGRHHIEFRVQPTSRTAGNVFSPAIQVAVYDSLGNLQTSESDGVSLAITSGTGADGATLAGTTTATVVGGVATFADLSITKAGTGYSLTASYSAPALTAVSTTFSIVAGPRVSVTVTGPGTFYSWQRQAATAEVRDAWGNVLAGYPVAWNTLNGSVAVAGYKDGLVAPVSSGQTVLQVDAGGVKGYALVTVAMPSAQGRVTLWRRVSAPGTSRILDVWAYSPSLAFAAGEHGSLLRYDGSAWMAQESGTTTWLFGVWGADSNDVFVVGDGVALRYTGGTWASVAMPGGSWRGVWGSGPRDVWAVGTDGQVARFDGTAWALMAQTATTAHLFGVWGTSASDVFAVGNNGTVIHYDGIAWSVLITTGVPSDYFWDVTGTGPGDVLAGGQGGQSRRFNGTSWSSENTGFVLQGVWASAVDENYAAANPGPLAEYSAGSWRLVPVPGLPASSWMSNIAGVPGGGAWAVGGADGEPIVLQGYRGARVTVTPATPTLTALGATQQLTATARDAAANPVAGVMFTWSSNNPDAATVDPATGVVTAVANGTATVTATAPGGAAGTVIVTIQQVAASVALSPGSINAGQTQQRTAEVRDSLGHLIPGPPLTWASLNPAVVTVDPSTGWITGVAAGHTAIAVRAGDAIGYAGVQVVWGTTGDVNLWAPMSSGTTQDLTRVWAPSAGSAFAVGAGGTILHYDGSSWTPMASGVSEDLRSIEGLADTLVWAGGGNGTMLRFDGAQWRPEALPSAFAVEGVWPCTPRRVYAVGSGGLAATYDGSAWAPLVSGTSHPLLTVFSEDGCGSVSAAGGQGTLLADWSAIDAGTTANLNDLWGHSGIRNFAVGSGGTILDWRTATRTPAALASGTTRDLWGVWGVAVESIWAAGDGGTLLYYNGAEWVGVNSGTTADLRDIGGTANGSLFAVGKGGAILRGLRGATVAVTPTAPTLAALGATQQLAAEARDGGGTPVGGVRFTWSSDNAGVASVDTNGLVTAHANGTATITATAPGGASGSTSVTVQQVAGTAAFTERGHTLNIDVNPTYALVLQAFDSLGQAMDVSDAVYTSLNPAVATASGSMVTAVGAGQATIAAVMPGGATAYLVATVVVPYPVPVNLWRQVVIGADNVRGVWGVSATDVFAVGEQNMALRFDGNSWTQLPGQVAPYTNAVWGVSANEVFAVGGDGGVPSTGFISHFDGTSWSRVFTAPSGFLFDVWGASARDVFAVGEGGGIYHFDGTSWSSMASGTGSRLYALWGSSASDVFAAGAGGTVVHFNGTAWSPMASGTSDDIRGAWGTSSTNVWAAVSAAGGSSGALLKFDGSSWTQLATAPSGLADGLWGSSGGDLYAGAWNAVVYRFNGSAWTPSATGFGMAALGIWGTSAREVFAVGTGGVIIQGFRGASVTVTPANPTITNAEHTRQLTATAKDASNNTVGGVTFTWTSSNESVATVSATGLVTAVSNGTTSITATAPGGAFGSTTVSVVP